METLDVVWTNSMSNQSINSQSKPSSKFWNGKHVLLTGHTGFKGAWLAFWLVRLGAKVTGIGLVPYTSPNLYDLLKINTFTDSHLQDIRDAKSISGITDSAQPEILFHLAAQPLVRASYRDPLETFSTNVQGTANLLDSIRGQSSVKVVVAITTDKVYHNNENIFPYREDDRLGGHDPYSASKAAAELVIASYSSAFLAEQGVAVASARAGNVIGGGDWSEDRLIPDAIRAWSNDEPLQVRQPGATRPWQHVLDPLSGYLRLAEQLWDNPSLADSYNFGPDTHEVASVRDIINQARNVYKRGEVEWEEANPGPHEANALTLEVAKARYLLDVQPRWCLEESIQRTILWYRKQAEGESAAKLCTQDIVDFNSATMLS